MKKKASSINSIYIISGKWKGKKIYVINNFLLKPTMNFIRQNLFNWIIKEDIHMFKCLDCYAGTGSLSFEALSRNAFSATLIENNYKIFQQLKKNIFLLKIKNIFLIYKNTLDFLSKKGVQHDLIFVDPPFCQKNFLLEQTCFLLEKNNWLKKNARIYIEYKTKSKNVTLPKNWMIYRKKKFSIVTYALCIRN
ncbi:16S rRNA (guanine(966)-N(2))-methyltransferase RsmD [Enterobacteriaceae endosymbiont of Donacia tomentosa]|uniref:16S rRNA (guanine(966)-N(2))-methyltransferase RsmD n=1 Tax=Enterobacteriaceae endosymbiont of Donacia tomentosa TaxID=2675787 RepID=UPI0014495793|nr:16S rRNA (guanine(966)-N(2))-methyltransferase RsmD [Enterobacteriaceae endosymbiont of Donacia tomentosa]QJC31487.1 16S rRNA (guanine(966)-N(2))-methyltransferase RsmD [Enterobacteriaceae endosymbiont of Donacia tomentosa]